MIGKGKVKLDYLDEKIGLELNKIRNDWDTRKWCRQVGLIDDFQQRTWLENQSKRDDIQMFGILSDSLAGGYNYIGVCGLTDIDYVHSRAEFSLYIFPEFRLNGYAKKALLELLRYGFNELGLQQIWGETFKGNPAYNLFKDIGMKDDGVRRHFYFKDGTFLDANLISILCGEWSEKHDS